MTKLLTNFKELIKDLLNTNGRIEKESILSKYKEDEEIKEILNFIFNPFIVTGISNKKLNKFKNNLNWLEDFFSNNLSQDLKLMDLLTFLNYFKIHNTGSDFLVKYLISYAYKNYYEQDERELLFSIVTKDLKLGVQPTTLNKVFGKNFIPQFSCMLAQKYFDDPDKLLPEDTEYILTTKLDGVRCLCIIEENGVAKFYSRQGQIFEGLTQLEFEFRELPVGHVYDGELLLRNDNNLRSKDLYRETMKVVSCDNIKENIIFNCFDILTIQDFKEGRCSVECKERKRILKERLSKYAFQFIKFVDILYQGKDQSQITYWLDKITSEGGEGVMINIANASYECKRTKNLLKVKKFNDCDVRVIDIEEGTGVNKNSLGAVKVEFLGPDNKIYTCKVGSGFKQNERKYFWEHEEEILNKIIEIGYFEITNNQNNKDYSLRFPTFKHLRKDKDDISMY